MNYDEHEANSDPGPMASQNWFVGNLQRVLKIVPKEKLICAVGNYGYDWTLSIPDPKDKRHTRSRRCWIRRTCRSRKRGSEASDADADLDLDYDSLNPHFEYIDEDNNQRHVVWFLDGVTLLDEMRAARATGAADICAVAAGRGRQLAVEHLGQAERSGLAAGTGPVQPGHDVDTEGEGDIMRVTGLPQAGKRTVTVDTDEPDPRKKLIIDEHMDVYPRTYTIEQYGYHPNEVALSFDDGPDPKWTPRILDILKQEEREGHLPADRRGGCGTCGRDAADLREGHEIGNHT